MNGYYGRQYSEDDLQRMSQIHNGHNMMGMMGPDAMGSSSVVGGQSLDDIVNQNSKEMRRRSQPLSYNASAGTLDGDMRRVSMMEFSGTSPTGALNAFQFDPSTSAMDGVMPAGLPMQRAGGNRQGRRPSSGELALDTQFAAQNSGYGPMTGPGSAYASPLPMNGSLDMDPTSPFVSSALPLSMNLTDQSLTGMMGSDMGAMNIFPGSQFMSPMMGSPLQQSFTASVHRGSQDQGGGEMDRKAQFGGLDQHVKTPETRASTSRTTSQEQAVQVRSRQPSMSGGPASNVNFQPALSPHMNQSHASARPSWQTPSDSVGGFPPTANNKPYMDTQYKNAYSSTGFDMLTVLMRVATRSNPEINIGSVDLSCAFVVCDAESHDYPIVYCSENFERLTGYTRHMILGRNCRFLQSPDGNVEAGIKRKYVDDESVLYLKNAVSSHREAQISLINYRRGGQPFMNLLTIIPITWDTDRVKFYVGFQVDLVEQPGSVTNKNPDGSFTINYQRGMSMPRYVMSTPENVGQLDMGHCGQTVPRDDVSTVLSTIGTGESELSRRIWDKVLLENTDDVVHVLSLKGLFLYLSPSSRRVLEYDSTELVGTALSSVCHPSDIVPVTRELKDTSSTSFVNVVFRIRRKHSGYMWFESHGSLHTEQGKGRKCIILVGRERPVYTLSKSDVLALGGIGDNELWTKLSTSGMFLFVPSNVRQLLDRQPDELVGTSMQLLMRQESKFEFARVLEMARTGKKVSVKHEMINKRGQVLQAFTTIYPGDASEGTKPTFLVAQTRLLKFTRGGSHAIQRPQMFPKQESDGAGSLPSATTTASTAGLTTTAGDTTPASAISNSRFVSTDGAATTFAGQDGLLIGRQDASLASEDNIFDELKTTRSTSWQYELRQMEKRNRLLAEEVQNLLAAKKKRKRRRGTGQLQRDCANCHTKVTPEWRRGPSGNRDLCNSCGLRWAKLNGRISPRTSSQQSIPSAHSDKASKASASPRLINAHENEAASPSSPTIKSEVRTSPQRTNAVSHAAKVARMEAPASQGFAGGVPEKIDEGDEPD